MNHLSPLWYPRAALIGLLLALSSVSAAQTAIVGARVYTMTGPEPLADVTVLVDDGVVTAIGEDLDVPIDYEIVDGAGRIVTPSLVAGHTFLGLDEIGGEPSTVDAILSNGGSGPAFDVQYAINPASVLFPVSRVEGVLHAVVAPRPGNDPLAGIGAGIRLTTDDPVLAPQLALFGAVDPNTAGYVGGSRAEVFGRIRRALTEARRYSSARYRPDEGDYSRFDMAAIKRLIGGDLPLVLKIDRAVDIRQALVLARDFRLRLVLLGGAEAWQVADQLAAAGVPVVTDPLANLPRSFANLGATLENAARLHRAGVRVAFSHPESHNIRRLRQLAGNAAAYGMPWFAALRAITRTPVEIYDLDDHLGRIAVGEPANLVVWNGDPLDVTTWGRARHG